MSIREQVLQIANSDPRFQQAMSMIEQRVADIAMVPEDLNDAIKLLEFVIQNPEKYQEVRQAAIQDGMIDPQLAPPQFDQVYLISLLAALYGLQENLSAKGYARGGLVDAVNKVRAAGRGGDTELAHINRREAAMLRAMGGSGTVNPNTGLIEYKSKFGKIVAAVAPIALNFIVPGAGAAIGAALGATGTAASALGGASIGGASSALSGGNILQGAALGGLGGGLGSAVGGGVDSALGLGMGEMGKNVLGNALVGSATSALSGGNPLKGGLIGAAGGLAGGIGGQLGLNNGAIEQGLKGFGNALTVGHDLKTSATAGALSGLSSALFKPGESAAQEYKAGQDQSMYGKGAVERTDIIPNDAQGNTIGAAKPEEGGLLGGLAKYAPLAMVLGSGLGGSEAPTQEIQKLSPEQQAYLNRPGQQWDWSKLQQEAQNAGMPLQTYISQNWNRLSSGAYNTPVAGFARGGLAEMAMGGRADTIPARLSHGEYVIDAETVAMLGDGSGKEGARRLETMRKNIRKHKGKALAKGKISPDAKMPEEYLKGAKK